MSIQSRLIIFDVNNLIRQHRRSDVCGGEEKHEEGREEGDREAADTGPWNKRSVSCGHKSVCVYVCVRALVYSCVCRVTGYTKTKSVITMSSRHEEATTQM